ncbi:MAG TPA: LysM domain-containing protein [Candidatus Obscuribacterales bacterium]
MLERTFDKGDRTNIEAAVSDASYNLFADAYNLPRPVARSQQVVAEHGDTGSGQLALSKNGPESQEAESEDATDEADGGSYDEFPFEMIFQDVQPQLHTVGEGETLEALARQHLGPDASDEDVQNHVREMVEFNGGQIVVGQQIVLPGHTADGDVVLPLKDGSTYIVSGDPIVRGEEQERNEALYAKPPEPVTENAPQVETTTDPDAPAPGCFRARVHWRAWDRDRRGRPTRVIGESYEYWRCPPDYRGR